MRHIHCEESLRPRKVHAIGYDMLSSRGPRLPSPDMPYSTDVDHNHEYTTP
jgi:hypothetical protein